MKEGQEEEKQSGRSKEEKKKQVWGEGEQAESDSLLIS